jgi:hypothetical protein
VHSVLEPVLRVGLEQTHASHQQTAATALQYMCNVDTETAHCEQHVATMDDAIV